MSALRLSYIIPALNARRWLEITLPLHAAQTVREGVEWIAVLSGATAREDAAWIANTHPWCIVSASDRPLNVSEARNRGADLARGEWLAFIDADTAIAPEHTRRILERTAGEGRFMGGPAQNGRPESLIAWADWYLTLGEYGPTSRPQRRSRIPGCQMILHRELWKAVGGFDPKWVRSQDMEICHRAGKMGVLCDYDPALAVRHLDQPETPDALVAHQRRYAEGAARLRLAGMGRGRWLTRHPSLWPLIPPLRWVAALGRILRHDPSSLGKFLACQYWWWVGAVAYARAFGSVVREKGPSR